MLSRRREAGVGRITFFSGVPKKRYKYYYFFLQISKSGRFILLTVRYFRPLLLSASLSSVELSTR